MSQVFLRDQQQDDETTTRHSRIWNTGNYFFLDAVERQLHLDEVVYSLGTEVKSDTLVLSMSNFISPTTDMGSFADYIERNDFERVVMIGAGAQAQFFDKDIELSEGTQRFVRAIAERSTSIGVRGEYTAYILERYGIKNVRIIGCPTIFWSGDRDFRVPSSPSEPSKFAVNITPSGHYRDKLALFLRQAVDAGAQYITQDENFVEAVGPDAAKRRMWVARYYGACFEDPAVLEAWLADEVHHYSIDAWIEYMKQFDFVAGTRFHGNMAAIQAGLAPLNIVLDSRTKELCDFLNLPYLNFARYAGESLAELTEPADYSLFNSTYTDRFDNYVEFLDENGIRHQLGDRRPTLDLELLDPEEVYQRRSLARYQTDVASLSSPSVQSSRLLMERQESLRRGLIGEAAENGTLDAVMSRTAIGNLAAAEALGALAS